MTVVQWIKDHVVEHGKDSARNSCEVCRKELDHNYSQENWNRLVRRVCAEIGFGSELGTTPSTGTNSPQAPQIYHEINNKDSTVFYDIKSEDIKTVEDLINFTKIDTAIWEVTKVVSNKWGGVDNPMTQVKAWFSKKVDSPLTPAEFVELYKEAITYSSTNHLGDIKKEEGQGDLVYLLSTPDMHFGKMISKESIGGKQASDYNLEVASNVFRHAILYLSNFIDVTKAKQIVFPIGEDVANCDSMDMKTTAGTDQAGNSDVYAMIQTALNSYFVAIDYLAALAPVFVPQVSGNHDRLVSYLFGLAIEQRYKNNPRVTVDSSPSREKMYHDGDYCFLMIHGDKLKPKDIAWRLATKYPEVWAKSKHRYAFSGHYHSNSVIDEQGVRVTFLPTLSPSGMWEDSMNYFSAREAQIQVFHPKRGRISTAYYSPEV